MGELFGKEFEEPNELDKPITEEDLAQLGLPGTLTMEDYATLDPHNYSMDNSAQENFGMEGVDVEETTAQPDTQGNPEADASG